MLDMMYRKRNWIVKRMYHSKPLLLRLFILICEAASKWIYGLWVIIASAFFFTGIRVRLSEVINKCVPGPWGNFYFIFVLLIFCTCEKTMLVCTVYSFFFFLIDQHCSDPHLIWWVWSPEDFLLQRWNQKLRPGPEPGWGLASGWSCWWSRWAPDRWCLRWPTQSCPWHGLGPENLLNPQESIGLWFNSHQRVSCYFSQPKLPHIPVASCSERLAIVTWAGVMVEGCRARLVSGWMTTLADTEGSAVDMSWPPEWETSPVSTLRGWERRPPCCKVCWRRAGSIWKQKH